MNAFNVLRSTITVYYSTKSFFFSPDENIVQKKHMEATFYPLDLKLIQELNERSFERPMGFGK